MLFASSATVAPGQRAIQLPLGKFHLGARIRELTVGLRGYRLERAGIDEVKQVAGVDEGAVPEFDTVDEAADAGANLNLLDRIEPPGELVPVRDGSLDGLGDGDGRGGGRGLRLRLLAAASERQREQHTDRCPAASWKATKRTAIEPGRRSRMLRSVSRTHFRLPKDLECCN